MNKMWRLLCWPGEKGEEEEEEKEEEIVIPEDLHEEILQWLPSSVLIKLKLVCKEWNRLISSPEFIQKHLERSKSRCTDPRILIPRMDRINGGSLEIVDYANGIITNKICLGGNKAVLLGSFDGLVVCYNGDGIVALNPSTGKYSSPSIPLSIPELKEEVIDDLLWSWFGRHPCTGEHVLVLGTNRLRTGCIQLKVYSLSRNSLLCSLTIEVDKDDDLRSLQRVGSLLNGKLHFQTSSGSAILGRHIFDPHQILIFVYDFETNRMERMQTQPPPSMPSHCCSLGVVSGCLCAIIWIDAGSSIQVWMMKEYGVEESWSKYADFESLEILEDVTTYGNVDVILKGCNFSTGAKRVWGPKLVDASLKGRSNRIMMACFDSLVSPALVWS